jgi:hypothetical protein
MKTREELLAQNARNAALSAEILDLLSTSSRAHYGRHGEVCYWPDWITIYWLADAVFGHEPTRSEEESVRRAVKGLAAEGLLETGNQKYTNRIAVCADYAGYDQKRLQLIVRPCLTDIERAAEQEMKQDRAAWFLGIAERKGLSFE